MSHETTVLHDPNFEGLLREAAAAPNSMLLRVDRPQLLTSLRQREAPVGIAMAGLSSVERELLASYRGELGLLLRQAALRKLMHDEVSGRWIDPSISDGRLHELPSPAAWAERASNLQTSGHGTGPSNLDAGLELVRSLSTPGTPGTGVVEIGAIALRVEPKDEARIYVAAFLAVSRAESASLQVLSSCLDGRCSAGNLGFALEVGALAYARRGEFGNAVRFMETAAELQLPRSEIPLRWLVYSILSENPHQCREAIKAIDRRVSVGQPPIEQVRADVRAQVNRGDWRVTARVLELLESLRPGSCPAARRIIDAFG